MEIPPNVWANNKAAILGAFAKKHIAIIIASKAFDYASQKDKDRFNNAPYFFSILRWSERGLALR